MPSIDISLNFLWIPVIALVFAGMGYALQRNKLRKARKEIMTLENEMLKNHAEILFLQKELANFRAKKDLRAPVVRIKDGSVEDKDGSGVQHNR
jgi:RNase P protein component